MNVLELHPRAMLVVEILIYGSIEGTTFEFKTYVADQTHPNHKGIKKNKL